MSMRRTTAVLAIISLLYGLYCAIGALSVGSFFLSHLGQGAVDSDTLAIGYSVASFLEAIGLAVFHSAAGIFLWRYRTQVDSSIAETF